MTVASQNASCYFGLVDSHTHWLPYQFPAYLGQPKCVAWPSMALGDLVRDRKVIINGMIYRAVTDSSWDAGRRLQEMTPTGVTHQVVSPMLELLSYWLAAYEAPSLNFLINEELVAIVSADLAHFTSLCALPMQDVELDIVELERYIRLGLAGVELGTNINVKLPVQVDHALFFAASKLLCDAIFVHALRPAGMERLVGLPPLEQVQDFPSIVGLATASLLTSGTLARLPKLRIAFSHVGDSLAILLPRQQHRWEQLSPIRKLFGQLPRELFRQLFVDDLVYDAKTIRILLQVFGTTQALALTDYTFAITDREPSRRIDQLTLDAATCRLLRQDNALRWLGRDSS